MAESSTAPITPELGDPFCAALHQLRFGWTPAEHGPLVPYDQRHCTIDEVFDLAFRHDDQLPDDVSEELFAFVYERHSTYATAADCLLKRIKTSKKNYQLREERRNG